MGYQALLFCPDEKLARVVSQIFSELDFSIDAVHEPFAAVKKLMSQRYDAIVVDCENEQNASLLFKSARNSTSNQSSLAIALVEGQAGVAKSYRIGANLVLTKPINVEQAKGTLRVARGLLRKNLDAAAANGAAGPVAAAKNPDPTMPQRRENAAPLAAADESKNVVSESAPPVLIPSAPAVADAVMVASAAIPEETKAAVVAETSVAKSVTPLAAQSHSVALSNQTSAAAVAPAKEPSALLAPSKSAHAESSHAFREAQHSAPEFAAYESAPVVATASAPTISHSPTFGALDEAELNASQGSKKFLIAAAVVALAVLGYFGYEKFAPEAATPATTTQRVVIQEPAPAQVAQPEPVAQPATTTSSIAAPVSTPTNPNSRANAAAKNFVTKTAAVPDKAPGTAANAPKISESSDDAPLKFAAPTPVHVKPGVSSARRAEDVAVPPSIAVANLNDNQLSGLMASATPTLPKQSPGSVRISQGVSQGLLIRRVPPQYPPAAKATHTQGEVRIEATINKEGMVVNPKVLRGDAILAHAAVEAVRQWRYKPYYLDGQPVEIQTEITINFKAN
jgi:TonB family protein